MTVRRTALAPGSGRCSIGGAFNKLEHRMEHMEHAALENQGIIIWPIIAAIFWLAVL